jgi:preprotein translocase subunit SecE
MAQEKLNIIQQIRQFLREVWQELQRVNWSTRAQLIQSTKVVILSTFVMALYLFAVDTVFSWILKKFLELRL